jgi:uncharacterized C2H2 Zn-finger protein
MSEKTVTMVVCDLHERDHPGTHKITIDVCDAGLALLQGRMAGTKPFPCPECERQFRSKAGLTKHLTDTHGHEPTTERARARRNGNGPEESQ